MVGKKVWIGVAGAAILWFVMFSPWTAPKINFWLCMAFSGIILTTFATLNCPEWRKDVHFSGRQILLGLLIAFILWWVFWIGDKVAGWLFGFERAQVNMIYGMKADTSAWLIAILLLFIIGPAEEIFWRGFVQRRLSQQWNANIGFIVTLVCYTLIHIWSLNFMLIMAALVVGFCWGLIYRLRPQWLTALIISHAVWDTCAFVLIPF
jgi:membrane protease YdiL (CAAX protease family)